MRARQAEDQRDRRERRRWVAPLETERERIGGEGDERAFAAGAVDEAGVEGIAFAPVQDFKQVLRAGIGARERAVDLGGLEEEEVPANYEYKFIEFINPEILELSDEQVELYEGCLSFPGHNGAIKRSKHVKVKAQDRHGEWFELEADDMLARCIQHENNHLDGITIMDLAEHFYEDDYPGENED